MTRPHELETAGFDIYVDTEKLRDLPLPVEQMSIDDLVWCFNHEVWEKDGTDDWNLTPWEVVRNEPGTTEHRKRVEESDLEFPIIIIFHKHKWVILDGIHRLVKAFELGHKMIAVKKLTKDNEFYKTAVRVCPPKIL